LVGQDEMKSMVRQIRYLAVMSMARPGHPISSQ
jgi:hypothetical protein